MIVNGIDTGAKCVILANCFYIGTEIIQVMKPPSIHRVAVQHEYHRGPQTGTTTLLSHIYGGTGCYDEPIQPQEQQYKNPMDEHLSKLGSTIFC